MIKPKSPCVNYEKQGLFDYNFKNLKNKKTKSKANATDQILIKIGEKLTKNINAKTTGI